jgi:hypothetical protein
MPFPRKCSSKNRLDKYATVLSPHAGESGPLSVNSFEGALLLNAD